ncbi:VOC family protein [Geomonas paludis]|uniref:Glyoxalase n=1 Tax=Geomonas paludis TaxID=2740185 RepID=A0A6V8N338_9BACT|nr:VOC family protein [Geomonas paludis]UPU34759.1 VOC family protein [Geomonas paludis]GFO66374.1 glyoxalase [Geomonas paludis]
MTKAIPEGFHSVTPMFMFKDCRKAIDFYKNAFGAVERYAMPGPNGGIMHAEVMVGDSIIMMGDEFPGENCKSAETLGGSPISFYLYVENVDGAFRRALEAGAIEKMEVQDMFWGDRAGSLQDPFGYNWMLATHTRDLSPEEIREGAKAAFAQQVPGEIKS